MKGDSRPATYSLYGCKGEATIPLRAIDGVWWFCRRHGPDYEAKGYRPVDEADAAAQIGLAV